MIEKSSENTTIRQLESLWYK